MKGWGIDKQNKSKNQFQSTPLSKRTFNCNDKQNVERVDGGSKVILCH